jgi:hypothetical protein
MLKLTASYSKKVPVAGQDYSSQSYHAAVEVEIPDGLTQQQLDARIHDTFEMVRGSVESELNTETSRPVRRFEPVGNGNRAPSRQGNGGKSNQAASGKQIGYLRDIAVRQGMTSEQLDAEANRMFGVADIGSLTRQEASQMIDSLNANGSGTRRKAA